MTSTVRGLIVFLATGAYTGYFPRMPGTAGTVAGLFLFLLLAPLSVPRYIFMIVLLVGLSIWLSEKASRIFNHNDPPQVVIDEICGYLITMASFGPEWHYLGAGFLLFRLFDIAKPFPAGRINARMAGGPGIVLDDVVAGIYANIVLQVVRLAL